MIDAVVGFLFSEDCKTVVLIKKKRPDFHKGLLNGVGGKCEVFEPPYIAMRREFFEETGLRIDAWEQFAQVESVDHGYRIFFLRAFGSPKVKSMTDEPVGVYEVAELQKLGTTPNLQWLIPLALIAFTSATIFL